MNIKPSVLNLGLPTAKADLPDNIKTKVTALKNQKLTNVFDKKGKAIPDKEAEWNSKFEKYGKNIENLEKLERESAALPTGKYFIDYVKEIRVLEADIELQQKDLYVMINESPANTAAEKAAIKAENLVQETGFRLSEKGIYAVPTGRQRAK